MGEAIMASVGRSGVLPGIKKKLITRIFTSNDTFVFPGNVVNNEIHVLCYGGGGGSGIKAGGGGGGWLNYMILNNIASQTLININIGKGGVNYGSGGTTKFGNFVSATGGSSGSTNGNIEWGGWINFRLGGVGLSYRGACSGGNGGSGGGGMYLGSGGTGFQFGGGGGGSMAGIINSYNSKSNINGYKIVNYTFADAGYVYNADAFNYAKGGDGGQWGGGGGGGVVYVKEGDDIIYIARGGNGGNCAGNGSGYEEKASDGIAVSTKYFPEYDNYTDNHKGGTHDIFGGCGGGGYGGAGGNGSKFKIVDNVICAPGSGGGGGYYAKGGDGYTNYFSSFTGRYYNTASGGGGGYGGNGADGNENCGGGGGGYGPSNYGAGGGGTAINGLNGKDGICIIQYYEMVME